MRVFEKAGHKIIWGDALDILTNEIKNHSMDLIFADPPYNIGKNFVDLPDRWDSEASYLEWCYKWLELCIKKLKDNGSMYVMASTQSMPYFDIFLRDKVTILSRIIWYYDSSGVQAKRYFGSLYEPILYCVKDSNSYTFNPHSEMRLTSLIENCPFIIYNTTICSNCFREVGRYKKTMNIQR